MPVYECGKCEAALPPGVRACPKCGDEFEEVVPGDAVVPPKGFSVRHNASETQPPLMPTATTPEKPSVWNKPVGGPVLLAIIVLAGVGWLSHGLTNSSGDIPSKSASTLPVSTPSDNESASDTSASPDRNTTSPDPQLRVGSENFTKESDFDIVAGEITNISGESLGNVEAVTTFYDASGNVVKTEDALIDYNPILPGQTSPYKTMATDNPLIKREKTAFQVLGGSEIETTTSMPAPSPSSDRAAGEGSSNDHSANPSVPVAAFRARLNLARNSDIKRCIQSVSEGDDVGVLEMRTSREYMTRTAAQKAEMRQHFLNLWRKVSLDADSSLSAEDNFISIEDSNGNVLGTLSSKGYEDFTRKG